MPLANWWLLRCTKPATPRDMARACSLDYICSVSWLASDGGGSIEGFGTDTQPSRASSLLQGGAQCSSQGQSPVGAGLPAMAVGLSRDLAMTLGLREQARSYRGRSVFQPGAIFSGSWLASDGGVSVEGFGADTRPSRASSLLQGNGAVRRPFQRLVVRARPPAGGSAGSGFCHNRWRHPGDQTRGSGMC